MRNPIRVSSGDRPSPSGARRATQYTLGSVLELWREWGRLSSPFDPILCGKRLWDKLLMAVGVAAAVVASRQLCDLGCIPGLVSGTSGWPRRTPTFLAQRRPQPSARRPPAPLWAAGEAV